MAQFSVKPHVKINYEKLCRGNTDFLHYDKEHEERWLNSRVNLPAGSLVILDEGHKCKGTNSLNAGLLAALKRQGYRSLLLSATMATNPLEMRAFGYAMNLHNLEMKPFKQFCRDYGAEDVGKWGAQYFDMDSSAAQAKMRLLHDNLFGLQHIASRLTREDMGALFPENQVIAEAYDMGNNSKKIQNIYDEMEEELLKLDEQTENYSGHILAIITKARRRVEMQKVPAIVEMVEDLYDEGKSVAVFVNYSDTIEAINKRLVANRKFGPNGVGLIYGGRSHKKRGEYLDRFQADQLRVVICNLAAGGQSIDLHDLNGKHPRVSIINPSYSAIHLIQATGRIHRQGGVSKCYQRIIYSAGTIEERACYRVQFKLNNLSVLNDGDLTDGMRFFRFVMGKAL